MVGTEVYRFLSLMLHFNECDSMLMHQYSLSLQQRGCGFGPCRELNQSMHVQRKPECGPSTKPLLKLCTLWSSLQCAAQDPTKGSNFTRISSPPYKNQSSRRFYENSCSDLRNRGKEKVVFVKGALFMTIDFLW